MVIIGLFIIFVLTLFLPFMIKKIEDELEVFLFIMGCISVTVTSQWRLHLIEEALVEPIKITLAVFIFGFLFKILQKPIAASVNKIADKMGIKLFVFLMIISLGLLSSVITAIIAALLLVEIISHLTLDRKTEIFLVVLTCFSIGLGAVLTPLGEPLSTIVTAKLKGPPYYSNFFFLFDQFWKYIIPGIVAFGLLGMFLMPAKHQRKPGLKYKKIENIRHIFLRSGKVYLFIMALIFLGKGFKPIVDAYITKIPFEGLYWLNIISAILDNATLAAAEIGSHMNIIQLESALIALMIAGGMLIPGNIPNIISAGKLKIKSSEWAKLGIPIGLITMLIYFFILMIASKP